MRGVVYVRMVDINYAKVLWKILCNSCCTVEIFPVNEEDLLGMTEGIEGSEEWMAEWRNKGDEHRVCLMLDRSMAGVREKALVRIDRVVMGNVLK